MTPIAGKVRIGVCRLQKTCFERFHAAEIQQTFYDPPSPQTLEKWKNAAPENFGFTLKAWQVITHQASSPTYRRMRTKIPGSELSDLGGFRPTKWVMLGLEKTLEAAAVLSAKVVVFQCPSSFLPSKENIENLSEFMLRAVELKTRLGINPQFAWEPRGSAWDDKLILDICSRFNLIHAVDIFERKPVTDKYFYFRLHGGRKYSHIYTDDELKLLIKEFGKYDCGYCMFNNINMFEDASRLLQALEEDALKNK